MIDLETIESVAFLPDKTSWQTIEIHAEMSDRAKIAAARLNSLGSLFWFSKYALRHTRLSPNFHGYLCSRLERDSLRLGIEVPRDHFKTTIASVSAPIWWALPFTDHDEELMRAMGYGDAWVRWMHRSHDTCTRTLIASEVVENAIKIGTRISDQYQQNALFRELFPEIIPKSGWEGVGKTKKKWNVRSMTHNRLGHEYHGEGTYDLIGVKGALQSRHYQRQVIDDPVGEKAIKSDIVMQDTCEWIRKLSGALDSDPNNADKLEDQLFIGNRWSQRDTGAWLRKNMPKMSFETHDAEGGCCGIHPSGQPIFPEEFSHQKLAELRQIWGAYDYACFPPDAKVLMEDWSEKPIRDLLLGDAIVGFEFEKGNGRKRRLVKAKVEYVHVQRSEIIKATTSAGREIYCSPDHKFLRAKKQRYGILKEGASVVSVYSPTDSVSLEDRIDYAWLGGLIDGEGAVKYGAVQIIQSEEKNPEVCSAIDQVLSRLSIPYTRYAQTRLGKKRAAIFTLGGGKKTKIMLLKYGRMAKRQFLVNSMWAKDKRIGEAHEKIDKIETVGAGTVFNIQSSSGNFVCQGYAVKNCQFRNNPIDPESVRFKSGWLRWFSINPWKDANISIANSQQTHKTSMTVSEIEKERDRRELGGEIPERLKAGIYHEAKNGEVIEDLRAGLLHRVAILDPNHSEETGRSRNAIIVLGFYYRPPQPRRIYLLESWAEAGSHDNMIGKLLSLREGQLGLAFKWRVSHVYLESKVAGQQGWYKFFRERVFQMGTSAQFSIRELKTDRSANAKQTRILGMEAIYENGIFWVNRTGCQQFLNEYEVYPNGTTIDLLDVAGYSPQCWEPGARGSNRDIVQQEVTRRQQMIQSISSAGY